MTADRAHHHDPGSRFEDAGIPDLQDGTPEQQWSEDPEELPLPGDAPSASVDWGTTAEEQLEGEPHSDRLARETPDPALTEIADDLDGSTEQDLDRVEDDSTESDVEVGRLLNDQAIEPGDAEVDTEAADVGVDGGGLTVEEQAMHLEPE
jgi:hypothetical protein